MSFDVVLFVQRIMVKSYGFLTQDELATLARHDRLRKVLVRFHEGRTLVAAESAADLINSSSWTVRDVSLPTSDPQWPYVRRMTDGERADVLRLRPWEVLAPESPDDPEFDPAGEVERRESSCRGCSGTKLRQPQTGPYVGYLLCRDCGYTTIRD